MKHIVLFAITSFILLSCNKDNSNNSNVPVQSVNVTIYPSDPQFATNIGVPGGWVYLTGGNKGIIVYRKSNTEFMAYDRTCTYDPNTSARLRVLTDNVTIQDTICNSKFLLLDGSVIQGPASANLKTYNCNYDGTVLNISN
ncbi:MAG: hypothetical protein ACK5D5_01355 [Bacteroidota bacterium]|jgi:nitrite reductase/ring-hydroxylating ferredoxin subunit